MKRRTFIGAMSALAVAPMISEAAEPATCITMINSFKTYEQADNHRMKIRYPNQYGVFAIYNQEDKRAYFVVVENRILRMFA